MYAMLISITIEQSVSLRFAQPFLHVYLSALVDGFFDVIALRDASIFHKFFCYARIRSRRWNENVSVGKGFKCLQSSARKRSSADRPTVAIICREHRIIPILPPLTCTGADDEART